MRSSLSRAVGHFVLGAGLLWVSGCATYLGYHYEYEDGPTTRKVLGRSREDMALIVLRQPTAADPTAVFEADATETTSFETRYERKGYRMDRYLPYNLGYDFPVELIVAGVLGPFDLLARIFGSNCSTEVREPSGSKSWAEWDEHKPDWWYLRNLASWLGWFLPGINILHDMEEYEYKRTPIALPNPVTTSQEKETRKVLLARQVIDVDLGPAGRMSKVTDDNGLASLDLKPFLPKVTKDLAWQITARLKDYPAVAPATLRLDTSALGVTWTRPPEKDQRAYEEAQRLGTVTAWRVFVRDYGNGPYGPAARESLAAAEQAEERQARQGEETAFREAINKARANRDASLLDNLKGISLTEPRKREIEQLRWEIAPKVRITGNAVTPRDIPVKAAARIDAVTLEFAAPGRSYILKGENGAFYRLDLKGGREGYVHKGLAKKE